MPSTFIYNRYPTTIVEKLNDTQQNRDNTSMELQHAMKQNIRRFLHKFICWKIIDKHKL